MLGSGRTTLAGKVALRAFLALVFFVLAGLQPALATAAVGHGDGLSGHHAKPPQGGHSADHSADHVHAPQPGGAPAADHDHAGEDTSDGCCEVSCAPVDAVTVGSLQLSERLCRQFTPRPVALLRDNAFGELIRPPRHLS